MINVRHADCRDALSEMESDSVDACVTDPPYALVSIVKRFGAASAASPKVRDPSDRNDLSSAYARQARGFMGKQWDNGETAFDPEFWRDVLRVLRPGAHLIAFGGTRTYHRLVCAIEDAGFEIRDQIAWLFGSGFPKSHNLDGAWEGWGTALKPAHEPICLARKAVVGTVAANVLQHGTGALHIDGCRVEGSWERNSATRSDIRGGALIGGKSGGLPCEPQAAHNLGRWPANVIHDGSPEVLAGFPESNGQQGAVTGNEPTANGFSGPVAFSGMKARIGGYEPRLDSGSAARFFYTAKADADDRLGSKHPTVKPVDLMAYLVHLVTPPGGVVLDPFAGSGTTGMACMREGFDAILIEREAEYVADIKRRIAHVRGEDAPLFAGAEP